MDTAAEEAFSLALRKDQSPIPSLLWQKAESIAWLRDTRSLSSGGNDFDSFGGCEDFGPRYGYGPCGEDGLCRLGFPSWSEGGSGFSYYEEEGWTDVCSARGLLPHRGPRWWQFFGDGGPHAEVPLAIEVECLLIDFHVGIMEYLRGFDPVTEGDGIATFAQDNIDIFPESNSLLMAAYHWAEEGGDRVKFYSAAEEGGQPMPASPAHAEPKGKAKALAEQIAAISEALPGITEQLRTMAQRQDKMDLLVAGVGRGLQDRVPAHRQLAPARFLHSNGSPPRARASPEKVACPRAPGLDHGDCGAGCARWLEMGGRLCLWPGRHLRILASKLLLLYVLKNGRLWLWGMSKRWT